MYITLFAYARIQQHGKADNIMYMGEPLLLIEITHSSLYAYFSRFHYSCSICSNPLYLQRLPRVCRREHNIDLAKIRNTKSNPVLIALSIMDPVFEARGRENPRIIVQGPR